MCADVAGREPHSLLTTGKTALVDSLLWENESYLNLCLCYAVRQNRFVRKTIHIAVKKMFHCERNRFAIKNVLNPDVLVAVKLNVSGGTYAERCKVPDTPSQD